MVGAGAEFAAPLRRRDDALGHSVLALAQRLLQRLRDLRVAGGLGLQVGEDLRGDGVAQGAGGDLVQQAQVALQGAGVRRGQALDGDRGDQVEDEVQFERQRR
ncbi:hypothetical protein SHKM778_84440 [Streptomyces sp. KM77-8]|uniref:Uncharacterized protein n=1 Tax=Streptomyces haneummycinicus TaxID=3074435 RepID=A0AAT9HWU1_9ACTN